MSSKSRRSDLRLRSQWTWEYETFIPSDPSAGVRVIHVLLDHLQAQAWHDRDLFAIHMSMEEAVMNAIKHGNSLDDRKTVHVVLKTSEEAFYACITDEGDGFDPNAVPDPTEEENVDRPCGRGVKLMRCYMDDVVYDAVGSSVEMFRVRRGSESDS